MRPRAQGAQREERELVRMTSNCVQYAPLLTRRAFPQQPIRELISSCVNVGTDPG